MTSDCHVLTGDVAAESDHFVLSEQLRIGLYVFIDMPWYRHPFTLNSFRIASVEQLGELRALNKPHFRYDPARSDSIPENTSPMPAIDASPVPQGLVTEDSRKPVPPDVSLDARALQRREHRLAVARAEKSFKKALGIIRKIDRSLLTQPEQSLHEATNLIGQMVGVLLSRPEVSLQIMGDHCGGEEACHHGLNVSVLSLMLAKGLELDAAQGLRLGIAALMHDIGLIEIPASILKKSPHEQTRPERELRAQHVQHGLRIGRQMGLDADSLAAIEQHHELADTSGYPAGLALESITPLARVVSLVNHYENLCNPVDHSRAMTPHEALSIMFARRKSQFDARVLSLMVRCLGVYPPGSTVDLSDDSLAMVVSVNPHKPLRPWVRVYDATTSKDDAPLLNLEEERDLRIRKSISPQLLPPTVRAYLSSRRRVTYFFDGGPPPPSVTK